MVTTVGILGYQGCIVPHEEMLRALKVPFLRVRAPEELSHIDRLIIPGGESTTMLRFMRSNGMMGAIRDFSRTRPVWGICAGAILVATQVSNPEQDSLGIIDIAACRNFYGSQIDSFSARLDIDLLKTPIEAQFIRAPLLSASPTQRKSAPLHIHAELEGKPVFFSQGNVWACSFHVELGANPALHQRFVELSS